MNCAKSVITDAICSVIYSLLIDRGQHVLIFQQKLQRSFRRVDVVKS